jgi:hypothetical protein
MSVETALSEHLRDRPLPGEAEAAARSWPVVEAALAGREPLHAPAGRASRRPVLRLALVAALLAAGLAAALSPAGAAVGDWIGDRLARESGSAKPAFAGLPRGGSVLAISHGGAYAIRPDGSTRHLGAFSDAGWSPHGLHVVGAEGRRLVAVDAAAGTIKWTLTRPSAVSHPAWSTELGYAVAYVEGHSLRLVAGNGDPTMRRGAAPVAPAWRPHSDRVLTYVTAGGALETVDVETGRTVWKVPASSPRSAVWAHNHLVSLSSRSITVSDQDGHAVRTIALPGVARDLAVHPSGRRAAVVLGNRVVEIGLRESFRRQLFQGSVDGIAWSQDGHRLLVGWRNADQWLILGPGRRVRALHGVSRELGVAGGFPRVAAWCCAR